MVRKPTYAQYEISLKVVLKNKRGETLLMRAISTGSMPWGFDLPGGRIMTNEFGSSIKRVLKRELAEELGSGVRYRLNEVPVALGRHSYRIKRSSKYQPVLWILFEGTYLGGTIQISPEHPYYAWRHLTKVNFKPLFERGARDAMTHYFTHKLP